MAGTHTSTSTTRAASKVLFGDASFNMPEFVNEVWSSRVLAKLNDKTLFTSLCNRDYEGEIKGKGDSVRIFDIAPLTARPYAMASGRGGKISARTDAMTYDTLTANSMVIKVDQSDYYGFEVHDLEEIFSNPKYFNKAAATAAEALNLTTDRWILGQMILAAKQTVADEFGRVGGGTHALPITTGANGLYEGLVDLGIKMDDELVSDEGRWIVLPTFAEGALRKDDRFVAAGAEGAGRTRDKGYIGDVAGFKIYTLSRKTLKWYSGGGADEVTFLGPDGQPAFTAPTRGADVKADGTAKYDAAAVGGAIDSIYEADGSDAVYTTVAGVNGAYTFVDALTKNETLRLQDDFADAVRGLHVYGGKAVRPNHLFAVTTTDAADDSNEDATP